MQNVQTTAEIQQRVINLVELYRTKVGKESKAAKDLAEEYKNQYDNEMDIAMYLHEQGTNHYTLNIDIPEEDVDWIRVNEQLLGHFYKIAAGSNADPQVLNELLADKYNADIYSEEEESFLITHIKELVNYIIQTPNNDLSVIDGSDRMDFYLIPSEVLELIKKRVEIPAGSTIYSPFTGFAQLAGLYSDCSFLCEESYISYNKRWNTYCDKSRKEANVIHHKIDDYKLYAWMKVALYANNIDATIIDSEELAGTYNAVVSFLPWIPNAIPTNAYGYIGESKNDKEMANKLYHAYLNLPNDGKMVIILPTEHLHGSTKLDSLWKTIISDNSLVEVIQLPPVMGKHLHGDCSIVIADKGRIGNTTTFIDARFAYTKTDAGYFKGNLDLAAIDWMLNNNCKEETTGLRKSVDVPISDLQVDLLVPQVYVVERPAEDDKPVSLSALCQLVSKRVRDVKEELPLDTPIVSAKQLSSLFIGKMSIETIEKANCPNNPPHTEDYCFDNNGNFIDDIDHYIWGEVNEKSLQVAEYRQSKYLDGNKDAVLISLTREYPKMALYRSAGSPIAIETHPILGNKYFHVFCPKDGVDALHLLAILRNPIVYRQLQAYEEFGLYGEKGYLKDVLVPTDKRLIMDEISKMQKEETAIMELKDDYVLAQKKHNTKLEDYQHAMRKHIREMSSSVRRMERFINDMDSSEEVKTFLNDRLAVIKTHRLYLSEDIERLNEENTYGEASPFDIDHSLRNYREYFGFDVCPIKYTNKIANDAIRQYRMEHRGELKELDEKSLNKRMEAAFAEGSLAYVDIAEYNFGKIVRNILENAKKHGFEDFTDVNRKDCVIEIALNWDKERQMYRIDFRNNGNPLPEGLTRASYGENRKYAGRTGGTGIGGYEVAENVRHYNGDYAISQDGDWIVVSIYLPKSKTYGERL